MGNDKIIIDKFFKNLDLNKKTTTEIDYSKATAILENGVFQAIFKIVNETLFTEIFIFDNREETSKKISLLKTNLKLFVNKDLINGLLFEVSSVKALYFETFYLNKKMLLNLVKYLNVDLDIFIEKIEKDYSNIRIYSLE